MADVEITVVAVVVIALEFAVPVPCCVDVLSDVVVDAMLDTVAGAVMDFVPDIGVEVVADVDVYGFAAVMTVWEPGMPTPSEELRR